MEREILEYIFNPRSLAIIGASNDLGKMGGRTLNLALSNGYKGNLYPVNPTRDSIMGLKCYRSLDDIHEKIEKVIVAVSAKNVPSTLEQCASMGVKVVQILTSGFEEENSNVRQQLLESIRSVVASGTRVIGPNCVGSHSVETGFSLTQSSPQKPGNIALISQSGGLTIDILSKAKANEVPISKGLSVGNCFDLDHPDFLEMLANDPSIDIISFYIESVGKGRRFFDLLKETTVKKPVIILKGGRGRKGAAAVASHTGRMTGEWDIWRGLFKQTGVMAVNSTEQMIDNMLGARYLTHKVAKKSILVLGNSGGAGVITSDALEQMGWRFPDIASYSSEISNAYKLQV